MKTVFAVEHKYIRNTEDLVRRVARLKGQKQTIVFTNGGFNILHVGHVRSLQSAKSLGDVLIVALNSDTSLRMLKGPDYPVVPEQERLEVLAALGCVDLLTVFHDRTADRLIGAVQPHIYAKGTDYTPQTVPERDTVLSYGGTIAIVGDPKRHSSSEIIRLIRS